MSQHHTILRLGHQGDGIAEGPVFAPRTLPGEVVTGVRDGAQLTDIRIETPSGDRVQPPCRHYKACGGCQLQHASDPFVAEWKQSVVRAALDAHGIDAPIRAIDTSPPRSRRRATFSVRRTKKGALVGFHGRASGAITEIPDCQLLDPALIATRPAIEALAVLGASRKGELSVTVTLSPGGPDVLVTGGKPLDGPLRHSLAQTVEAHHLARLTWDEGLIGQRAAPEQRFGPACVVPPPGAFLQATEHGEAALLAVVQEITQGAKTIVDLFAGCGTFSLPLAARAEVHAVEGLPEMTESLLAGWRNAQGVRRVTAETRDLFRRPLMPDELKRFDAAVLDPPRAGAEAQVAELVASGLPALAYVSCNPVTFARDARALISGGYVLNWVQVVDQFRWSAHTELAGSFTRPADPPNRR